LIPPCIHARGFSGSFISPGMRVGRSAAYVNIDIGPGKEDRIREAYPSLALEVRNQRDMESFDQLLAGELDLAVRSREALPHGLRFEPLFASDRLLIVPRGHELAGKKRQTLRDLARHAFVIPPAGSRWRRKAGCPWAGDAGGYRRLIRNGRREAVAGGGGEEGGVGGRPATTLGA